MDEDEFNRMFDKKDKNGDAYAEPSTEEGLSEAVAACAAGPDGIATLCFGAEETVTTPLGGEVVGFEHNVVVERDGRCFRFFDEAAEDDASVVYPSVVEGIGKFAVGGRSLASYVPGVRVYPPMDDL